MTNNIQINKTTWGHLNGQAIYLYTLSNQHGMSVSIINRGATIQSVKVPDRQGNIEDVIVGYDSWPQYLNDNHYMGTLVGRCANRIAYGKFSLGDNAYQLALNHGSHQQHQHHGGHPGLHEKIWQIQELSNGIKMSCTSQDGEAGYPGTLTVEASFILTNDNELKLDIQAKTNQTTIVNITCHPYFNLSGLATGNSGEGQGIPAIDGHQFSVNAEQFLALNDESIPTGELLDVVGTPFDFQQLKPLGQDIEDSHPQLQIGAGYDHFFVFKQTDGQLRKQAELYEPTSGRVLELFTQQPGLQVYSSNFMNGADIGKNSQPLTYRCAFALEPQFHPDAPNHNHFPSIVLNPDGIYQHQTTFKFSTR